MPVFTLGDLQARVYARLDNNVQLYPESEVTNAINEAIRVLNMFTGFLQISIEVPGWSVINRVWYDVPSGILTPLRVQLENTFLRKTTIGSLGLTVPQFLKSTTANTGAPVSAWVPAGMKKFGIYPASSLEGLQILVTGIQEPVPLVNANDVVAWPTEITTAFDLLATMTLQLKESPAMFSQASVDYQEFMRQIKLLTIFQNVKMPRYWIPEVVLPRT